MELEDIPAGVERRTDFQRLIPRGTTMKLQEKSGNALREDCDSSIYKVLQIG